MTVNLGISQSISDRHASHDQDENVQPWFNYNRHAVKKI